MNAGKVWKYRDIKRVINMRYATYDESLMKLCAQQALFPLVPHNASDGLGKTLLDRISHARAVVDKLGVGAGMVQRRRREAS